MNGPSFPPLIDRHTHLEGALDPQWVRREANGRGLSLPSSLEALWSGIVVPFTGFIESTEGRAERDAADEV